MRCVSMALEFSGNWVEATGTPRVTSPEAFYREQATAKRTVLQNRTPRVLRAGRREPTGRRKQGRQKDLVEPDQTQEQSRHPATKESSSMISGRRSGIARLFQGDRRRTTMSKPAIRCCAARKHSLTQRLRQFRSTARAANRRPITIPNRARPNPFGRANTSKTIPRSILRDRNTARNDSAPLSLSLGRKRFGSAPVKRRGERAPWRGER